MATRAALSVDAPMLIVTAVNAVLLAALHALFASVVREPYMDDPFHVRAHPQPCHNQNGWSRAGRRQQPPLSPPSDALQLRDP